MLNLSSKTKANLIMKFGILTFSYKNFENFAKEHQEKGLYWVNLGDYMQSIAAVNVYKELGISTENIIRIDRDNITNYSGEQTLLIMNACFYKWCFPIPRQIIPLFVGFQAKEHVIKDNQEYLKEHEPIGCRDVSTSLLCKKYGINAYVTGCITLTFTNRTVEPSKPNAFLIYGSGAGEFPAAMLRNIPKFHLENLKLVYQRTPVYEYPLKTSAMYNLEKQARIMLENYKEQATLIITPLHHAAAPCLSSGIPTIIIRKQQDSRFDYLEKHIPIHLNSCIDDVNWQGYMPDISTLRTTWISAFNKALSKELEKFTK